MKSRVEGGIYQNENRYTKQFYYLRKLMYVFNNVLVEHMFTEKQLNINHWRGQILSLLHETWT